MNRLMSVPDMQPDFQEKTAGTAGSSASKDSRFADLMSMARSAGSGRTRQSTVKSGLISGKTGSAVRRTAQRTGKPGTSYGLNGTEAGSAMQSFGMQAGIAAQQQSGVSGTDNRTAGTEISSEARVQSVEERMVRASAEDTAVKADHVADASLNEVAVKAEAAGKAGSAGDGVQTADAAAQSTAVQNGQIPVDLTAAQSRQMMTEAALADLDAAAQNVAAQNAADAVSAAAGNAEAQSTAVQNAADAAGAAAGNAAAQSAADAVSAAALNTAEAAGNAAAQSAQRH